MSNFATTIFSPAFIYFSPTSGGSTVAITVSFNGQSYLQDGNGLISIPGTYQTKLVAGTNVAIDETDPANPVLNVNIPAQTDPNWGSIQGTLSAQADLQTALDGLQSNINGKQAALVSASNIKTINGSSILGAGDLTVGGGGGGLPMITVTDASRALLLTEADKRILWNNPAVTTVTVPLNATVAFPVGTQIEIINQGEDMVVAAEAGVTLNAVSPSNSLTTIGLWNRINLRKLGTDLWIVWMN